MKTLVGNEEAHRQARNEQGRWVVSAIRTFAGWRFVVEELAVEPASNGLDEYTYWSERYRSGVYGSLEAAWAEAERQMPWLRTAPFEV